MGIGGRACSSIPRCDVSSHLSRPRASPGEGGTFRGSPRAAGARKQRCLCARQMGCAAESTEVVREASWRQRCLLAPGGGRADTAGSEDQRPQVSFRHFVGDAQCPSGRDVQSALYPQDAVTGACVSGGKGRAWPTQTISSERSRRKTGAWRRGQSAQPKPLFECLPRKQSAFRRLFRNNSARHKTSLP